MQIPFVKAAWHHVRYAPLWSALVISRQKTFEGRSRALGKFVGLVVRWFPLARRRIDREILRVYPDMSPTERSSLRGDMGQHWGRTLYEIYHLADFQSQVDRITVSGQGLETIEEARTKGKGAIIVSGHFGQWEAIRAVLKSRGLECGAVYKPQKNRHYQRRLLAGIEVGGQPIIPTGAQGTRALVQHLRAGGIIAILLDEKYPGGEMIPFLGIPAMTSLSAAQLALRYDLPMVPAFGTRLDGGDAFAVEFESEIPHSDPVTMTTAFNERLSRRILADPAQWYWLLRRWGRV